jgi:hypothetical protein
MCALTLTQPTTQHAPRSCLRLSHVSDEQPATAYHLRHLQPWTRYKNRHTAKSRVNAKIPSHRVDEPGPSGIAMYSSTVKLG